jgi:hypothetical protein
MQNANNRIKIDGLSEFINILKAKIKDSNKGVSRIAIAFTAKFAEACGKDIKMYSKILLCPLIENLADKNSLNRQEGI